MHIRTTARTRARALALALLVTLALNSPAMAERPTVLAQSAAAPAGAPVGAWRAIATSGAPAPRAGHTAVWTGTDLLVWGGERADGTPLGDGGRYNAATDTWAPMATGGAPAPRSAHTAVWTGTEWLIWGGRGAAVSQLADGAAYTPTTDTWRPLPPAPLSGRAGHTAVWTGSEMLVWGGNTAEEHGSGAAYNPATDTWRLLSTTNAPAGRDQHVAVWTGTEMVVGGGVTCPPGRCLDAGAGGSYVPATDTWRPLACSGSGVGSTAVWTGVEALFWGGESYRTGEPTSGGGQAYRPATGGCRPLARAGEPSRRAFHTAVWSGTELLVWGGEGPLRTPLADGAGYDPARDSWRPLVVAPLSPRARHTAVWTGGELLVWGGGTDFGSPATRVFGDGARYDPTASPAAPSAPPVPHDARYFAETGFRVEDDAIWDYFQARGGIETFGYPVSRTFAFLGCQVQAFQRQVAQVCTPDQVQLLNLLDPEIFPYTRVNGSTFPAPEEALKAATPKVGDPDYAGRILGFVRATAPDEWNGQLVNFGNTFFSTVSPEQAGTDDPGILGLLALEVWGAPISQPIADPANPNFIYQRFQRGIMHYDASTGTTQGILLADYLKSLLLGPALAPTYGASLPPDLAAQAQGSRFFGQFCPGAAGWLCRANDLPGTDLTFAFERG